MSLIVAGKLRLFIGQLLRWVMNRNRDRAFFQMVKGVETCFLCPDCPFELISVS